MAGGNVFSGRTARILTAVGVLAFVAMMVVFVFADTVLSGRPTGANSYSDSAIGHRAFVQTLRRLGIPVLVSRHNSARKVGKTGLLIIAEPSTAPASEFMVSAALREAGRVLYVLPKWSGIPDEKNPRWLHSVNWVTVRNVRDLLRVAASDGTVFRPNEPVRWKSDIFDVYPSVSEPQLMRTKNLTPVISGDAGVLLGVHSSRRNDLWVLSDPDLLSNHGLGRGDNAILMARIIEKLLPIGGSVVIDETVHGFQREPSRWRAMFEMPFVIATLMTAVAVVVLMGATTGRIGAPRQVKPPLEAGKTSLIDSTARLLQHGNNGAATLGRYFVAARRDVEERLHAPRAHEPGALTAWLDRVGENRGVRTDFRTLRRRVRNLAEGKATPLRIAAAARLIHHWKREMIHGPGGHPIGQPKPEDGNPQGGDRSGHGH
jgi:hypothetical protein